MPTVSVIVPCYNEETTICLLLEALYQQTFPRTDMEIIIADGLSSDDTRQQIENFSQTHAGFCVRVVDNHKRTIPSGLNRAIASAGGRYIVRLDAHSVPSSDYIERSVEALVEGRGDNVGGVWEIRPAKPGWIAHSIAAAAAHPLGVGDAHYRYSTRPQQVDTVPFGAFEKSLVERVGGFDETLLTNEDYEFNVRVRQSGGRVWLDPGIRSVYFARSTFRKLAQQYWRYGYWKARMLRRYPGTLRWRQAIPPLFVLSLLSLLVLSTGFPFARLLLAIQLALYGLVLGLAAVPLAVKKAQPAFLLGVPLAIAVMHISWGAALIWSLITSVFKK